VRELHLLHQFDAIASAYAPRGRAPLADAVQRQDRGFVKRTWEERARRVAFVVISKRDRRFHFGSQVLADHGRQACLLLEPDGHSHAEAPETGWRECQVGFNEPLKFPQRFFVEDDVGDVGRRLPALAQAVLDGTRRKGRVVLSSGESFFLRCGDDFAVNDKTGRAVVVERRDPENGGYDRGPAPAPRPLPAGATGFFPGNHSGLNVELASHSTGVSIDRMESVMWAKSMWARSSAGVWYSL